MLIKTSEMRKNIDYNGKFCLFTTLKRCKHVNHNGTTMGGDDDGV